MTLTASTNNPPRRDGVAFVLLALLPIAGFCVILGTWAVRGVPVMQGRRSAIVGTRPADGERAVLPSAFIAADLHLPHRGHGVDSRTISEKTVHLIRADDGQRVPAVVNTSGAGDAIVLTPRNALAQRTTYTFEVTSGLRDTSGASFAPYRMTFKTATGASESNYPVAFEKIALTHIDQSAFTALTIGPDHRLYAGTFDGRILRFDILDDGTLGAPVTLDAVVRNNGGPRLITGIRFDPFSEPDAPRAWISHGQMTLENADDWTGKISLLSGADLNAYQDVIIHLPRSHRDHLNNQLDFGFDGALYFNQASMTACGAPDKKWNYRSERLLSAAILRLDPAMLPEQLPIDVKTADGGTYDPAKTGAPLTIYATGVRVSFDLLWHSSGRLYAAVNGSARGGNSPGDRARGIPSLAGISTQDDFLFNIERGGYYGHPNPRRGEFVLNAGNPTSSFDAGEVVEYPVGTKPEPRYRGFAYDFGKNVSPNGMIEYRSGIFDGALRGKILVCRFSGGDDIVVLTPGPDGNITEAVTGIDGFKQFTDPLDLVEDIRNGCIYVAEYSGQRLTLLRPRPTNNGTQFTSKVFRQQVAATSD